MSPLRRIFTWWNGETFGLWLLTRRAGSLVGTDNEGNRYYRTRDGSRRWVVYNGDSDASRVPPEWHGWLHHTWAEPPTVAPPRRKRWEKPHVPNLTGTEAAYRPPGSLHARASGVRADYEAWSPGD